MSAEALDYLDQTPTGSATDLSSIPRKPPIHPLPSPSAPKSTNSPLPTPTSPLLPSAPALLPTSAPNPDLDLRFGEVEGRAWWLYFFLCFLPVVLTIICYHFLSRRPRKYKEGYRVLTDSTSSSRRREDTEEDWDPRIDEDDTQLFPKSDRLSFRSILYELRYHASAVFCVFFVTLALFPALTASVVPSGDTESIYAHLFVPLGFLCSGIGDWIGRTIPARPSWILTNEKWLLALSLSRAGFLFLFSGCNITTSQRNPIPPLFAQDAFFFLFISLFFVSGGYLSTVALMQAPVKIGERFGDAKAKGLSGGLMSLVLFAGLAAGSAASFGVRWVVFGEIW